MATRQDYTISSDQDPDREYLTPDQALACLVMVREYLGTNEPKLYRDHEGPYWNISYEGDYEWSMRICHDRRDQWPDGVFAEPVAGWCLGLYPA